MWEQYRKTLIPFQIFILAVTVTVYFVLGRQWATALFVLLVMEVGSLLGAAWGARLKRKIERKDSELPLHRKQ